VAPGSLSAFPAVSCSTPSSTSRSHCDRGRRHRVDQSLCESGWIGSLLSPLGIKVAFTPLGIFVALVFIGLPFVVRTVQPVLEDLEKELEEAAASLGAGRWTIIAASCCRRSRRRC